MKEGQNVFVLINEAGDYTKFKPDKSVEGFVIGMGAWVKKGISSMAQPLGEKAKGKKVIVNTNYYFEDDGERNTVAFDLKHVIDKVDGITIQGMLWDVPVMVKDMMAFAGKVYYTILADPKLVPIETQASFAQKARGCKCKGVIMTARFPKAIRAVREAVGKNFEILAYIEKGNKVGDGMRAGANFEILDVELRK